MAEYVYKFSCPLTTEQKIALKWKINRNYAQWLETHKDSGLTPQSLEAKYIAQWGLEREDKKATSPKDMGSVEAQFKDEAVWYYTKRNTRGIHNLVSEYQSHLNVLIDSNRQQDLVTSKMAKLLPGLDNWIGNAQVTLNG